MLQMINFDGSYRDAHSIADIGGEFVLAHSSQMDIFESTWRVPTKDLVEIYKRMNRTGKDDF
jgi:hypothetical protein